MPSAARRPVGNAGEDQLASVAIENDVPVLEREQSQFGKVRHPRAVAENIFVIAGDHVDAVGRLQVPQRLYVRSPRIEGAVDQVSRNRNQIHAEQVRSLYDRTRPCHGKQPTDVEIGQLQNGVAVELLRKAADGNLNILKWRNPHSLMDADRGRESSQRGQSVADAVRRAYDAAMDQDSEQKSDIERQLQQRQQDDRAERPVKEGDHRSWKLWGEYRT